MLILHLIKECEGQERLKKKDGDEKEEGRNEGRKGGDVQAVRNESKMKGEWDEAVKRQK